MNSFGFPILSEDNTMPIVYFVAQAQCQSSLIIDQNLIGNDVNKMLEGNPKAMTAYLENFEKENKNVVLNEEKKVLKSKYITAYPNPTEKTVVIKYSEEGKVVWNLITFEGKIISTGVSHNQEIIIDLENYCCGVYYLQLVSPDNNEQIKIVKQ